jgi:hypothetical protein
MVPMSAIPVVLAFVFLAQEAPPTGTIAGTVADAVSGAPLGKVSVRVLPAGAGLGAQVATTTSDAKGNFKLVNLAPRQYKMQAVRNGYLDSAYRALTLAAGEDIDGQQIKMKPYSVIAGTVRDPDGEPVSGATIELLRPEYEHGRLTVKMYDYFEKKTDDLGQYRIADLEPGKYYVRATGRETVDDNRHQHVVTDHSAKSDGPPTVLLPTLYPGVPDGAAARFVEVGPGARVTGIDIPLVRAATYRVAVQTGGVPVNDLFLTSNPDSLMLALYFRAVKNRAGDFEFSAVPAGLYTMIASGPARGGGNYSSRQTALSVSRDMNTRIMVDAPPQVTMHVRVEGKPDVTPGRLGPVLVSATDRVVASVPPDGIGIFMPPPDRYQLHLEALPGKYTIKSMRMSNVDVLRDGLVVPADGADLHVEVVLAEDAGGIDGTVVDKEGKPAAGATILLAPEPKLRTRYDMFHAVTADQRGQFHIDRVRPAEYKLFAWDDVEENAWFDPEFLKKYEDSAVSVSVPASGKVSAPPIHVQ